MGTPITGKSVYELTTPAKAAYPPAPHIRTLIPLLPADLAYLRTLSGALWAESTLNSYGILYFLRTFSVSAIVSASDLLPIKIPTKGLFLLVILSPPLTN